MNKDRFLYGKSQQSFRNPLLLLRYHRQQLVYRKLRIQSLWASHSTHTDVLALLDPKTFRYLVQTLIPVLIARVNHPTVGLHEHRRAEVLVRVPPVGWTGSRAARAQHTLIEPVQFLAVLYALEVFPILNYSKFTPSFFGVLRFR